MLKCLVIDDVAVSCFAVEEFLSDLKIDTIAASDLKEAQEILTKDKASIDFILLDWHLGGESGIGFLKTIREQHGKNLKVIIFSGVEQKEKENEALQAGANAFLLKPTTLDKLKNLLEDIAIL